jgi:hypothetical protein
MLYTIDENGDAAYEPDTLVWATWFGLATQTGRLVLARYEDEDITLVTKFTGIDQRHAGEDGAPILWETYAFKDAESPAGLWVSHCGRYTSKDEALEGHRRAVAAVMTGYRLVGLG